MRGVVFPEARQVAVREFPDPEPGPGEIVVRVRMAAICGSDLHWYREFVPGRTGPDIIVGHESVGEVAAVGSGVFTPRVGDRVALYHISGCGECPACRARRPKECWNGIERIPQGADADYQRMKWWNALPLPDEFSWEEGTVLACNYGTGYGALKRGDVSARSTLAVFGLGPVGLCTVQAGRALGARVIAVDVVPERLDLARQMGANETVNGSEQDVVAALRDLAGGRGVDTAIDTSGNAIAQTNALDAARPRGTIVFVGIKPEATVAINVFEQAVLKQLTVAGSWIYDIDEWPEMLAFVQQHQLPVRSITGPTYSLDDAPEAFAEAIAGKSGKIILAVS